MTKEIDLISVTGKSKAQSSTSNGDTKKEGSSLFDSILSSANTKSTQENNTTTKKTNIGSSKESKKESLEISSNNNASKKTVQSNNNEQKAVKTAQVTQTDEQSKTLSESVTSKKTESSLLDRMLVDAKVAVKTKKEDSAESLNKNNPGTTTKKENVETLIQEIKKDKHTKVSSENSTEKNGIVSEKETLLNKEKPLNVENKEEKTSEKKESNEEEHKTKVTSKSTIIDNKNDATIQAVEEQDTKAQKSDKLEKKEIQKPSIDNNTLQNSVQKENPSTVKKETTITDNNVKTVLEKGAPTDETTIKNKQKEIVDNENIKESSSSINVKEEKQTSLKALEVKPDVQTQTQETKEVKNPIKNNSENVLKSQAPIESANNSGKVSEVKNEKAAVELAKINAQSKEPIVETKLNTVLSDKPEEKPQKTKESLLDKLIKETETPDKAKVITTSNESKSKDDVLTNIYLSTQRKNINDKSLEVGHQGKEIAKNASGVEDVKSSAKVLDLNLQDTEVEIKTQDEKETKKQTLDKLAFNRNVANLDLQKMHESSNTQLNVQNATKQGNSNSETIVPITVSVSAAQAIQSRIIGARQQMSTMMSDVAKEMYQNYKPPVTAFRINLLPAHLGSIAIMMKSDKENSIAISLNMSNSATLDAMNDSESSLRNALAKNFGEDTSFSLDFNMQGENPKGQGQPSSEKDSKNNRHASNDILATRNAVSEEDTAEISNYM
jgi:flagellar hook-length control protein FliK